MTAGYRSSVKKKKKKEKERSSSRESHRSRSFIESGLPRTYIYIYKLTHLRIFVYTRFNGKRAHNYKLSGVDFCG